MIANPETRNPKPETPAALGRYFVPYQIEAIMEEARLVLWEKSIRIGATYCMAFRAVRRRVLGLGNYLHTSVNERIAQSFVRECKKFCEVFEIAAEAIAESSVYNPVTDRQESAFEIMFPSTKCAIKVFSSNPAALRGEGGEVGIDELSSHRDPDEMLKAAGGRAMWGYPVTIWTSHRGEASAFARLVKEERAKGEGSRWKVRTTTLFDALDQGLLDKINQVRRAEFSAAKQDYRDITREEFLADTMAMVGGAEAFEEECLCQPRKGGGAAIKWVFLDQARLPYRMLRADLAGGAELPADFVRELAVAIGKKAPRMALGYDVARTKDLSCIWLNAQEQDNRWRQRALITMRGLKFGDQRRIVERMMETFPTLVGAGDATGLGMQVCEELTEKFGPARFCGINFSASKPELGTKLVRVYEDGRQILPSGTEHEDVVYDLAAIRIDPNRPNRTAFVESPNPINKDSHCDIAWANALALYVGDDLETIQELYTLGSVEAGAPAVLARTADGVDHD